ncbi:hypothetical protein PN36_31555 [Candidatus Thiomargarita nelsonii]|uniref:Uncharacterized protein n=1 Tax=Candidatus Thiomargarita nelsonii TaxID=1003181 RepID=A0A0A6P8R7_9GAMM|nr:hypothetical protein PN36_31555 [Candidatus Thiomargarita nelsonii]
MTGQTLIIHGFLTKSDPCMAQTLLAGMDFRAAPMLQVFFDLMSKAKALDSKCRSNGIFKVHAQFLSVIHNKY